jgi:hypothetical protein
MADKKISELDVINGADTAADDFFVVVDTSGSATKKISRAELNNAIEQDVLAQVDITSANIDGGTIDNTPIGSTTASTGNFTTVDTIGNVTVGGNLTVNGTTTTVNSTTLDVDDINITVASGAANAAAADGAGLTVDGASATFNYASTGDKWTMNKPLDVAGSVTSDGLTVDGDGTFQSASGSTLTLKSTDTSAAQNQLVGEIEFFNSDTSGDGGQVVGSLRTYTQGSTGYGGYIDIGTSTGLTGSEGADTVKRLRVDADGDVSLYADDGTTQGFFWDASTQRLGLGLTNPAYVLDTNSFIKAGGLAVGSGANPKTVSIAKDGGGSQMGIDVHNLGTATGDDSVISFETEGSREWTVGLDRSAASFNVSKGSTLTSDPKLVVSDAGNVGIGVSTVSGKLHLSESGATNAAATIFSLDGYHSTFGANLAKSSGTYTTPAVSLSGGGWEYQPVNSLNNHGVMVYLSAPDTNTSASTPLERLRIDGSGNLLINHTATGDWTNTSGAQIRATGLGIFTQSGSSAVIANRLSTDGTILDLRKDGGNVGSVGVYADRLYAGTGDVGLWFNDQSDYIAPINTDTATLRDAAVDIGNGSYRFRHLHLSGGIYLGGSGAANYLNDYEEGTWTPTLTTSGTDFSSVVYVAREGNYTKVGNLVYISCRLYTSSVTVGSASGSVIVTGLPFTPAVQQSMPLNDMRLWTTNPSSAGTADGATEVYLFKRSSSSGAESQLAVSDVRTTNPSNLCQFSGCYIIA